MPYTIIKIFAIFSIACQIVILISVLANPEKALQLDKDLWECVEVITRGADVACINYKVKGL